MRIPKDFLISMLTPSITEPTISKGNKPGNFSTIIWLALVLIFTLLSLFCFSKPNKMEFYQGKWYPREEYVKLLRAENVYKYNPYCSVKKDEVLKEVQRMNNSTSTAIFFEKNGYGVPSEGANIKYYKFSNNKELIKVTGTTTTASFFTNYYVRDGNIFYVEEIIYEWDLKKLYDEHGELSPSEGRYAIGTTTKESYLLEDKLLCQIITDRPRQESAVLTASNPDKDLDNILGFYDSYLK